jgi:cyclophilin family peptidyl-prolyl cis-trans isomerase
MRRSLLIVASFAALAIARPLAVTPQTAKPAAAPAQGPTLVLTTTKGVIEIAITEADAPKSAARILELARASFYRGLRFHWVEPGVVQVGDPLTRDMTKQEAWGTGGSGRPIGVAEPSKKPFVRGSVGIAYGNGRKPESADSQIFIMRFNNPALNGKYAQIGHVTKGLDVLDKIVKNDIVTQVSVR